MSLVVVTQPYVPAYRVPLFDAIASELDKRGHELKVAAGMPAGDQGARGDASRGEWFVEMSGHDCRVGPRRVRLRKLPESLAGMSALVTEFDATNLTAWQAIRTDVPVILWGHGRPYVTNPTRTAKTLKAQLARRSAAVMTYSGRGKHYVTDALGIDTARVHVIGNSTDTDAIRAALLETSPADLPPFVIQNPQAITALYVGALEPSKRTGFLLEAFEEATTLSSDFNLVVVGRGTAQREVLALARRYPNLHYLPEARGADLARLGAAANAVWMPGRVGLVAVDALAMGLPVLTCHSTRHAPEIEFLSSGEVEFLPDVPEMFASEALARMRSVPRWPEREIRDDVPTIAGVASEFAKTVELVLAARGREAQ